MKFILNFLIIFTALSSISYAQDLLQERIWKISSRKRSVYFDKGVFHSDNPKLPQQLKSIRNSYIPSRGYERKVSFDIFYLTNPGRLVIDVKK